MAVRTNSLISGFHFWFSLTCHLLKKKKIKIPCYNFGFVHSDLQLVCFIRIHTILSTHSFHTWMNWWVLSWLLGICLPISPQVLHALRFVLFPAWSSLLCHPAPSACLLKSSRPLGSAWACPICAGTRTISPGNSLRQLCDFPHLFPVSQGSLSFIALCPVPCKPLFH